ncbi:MAG: fumarate hydratase C-terminal domain-containing protein [Coriobacteriaceae bacterium]
MPHRRPARCREHGLLRHAQCVRQARLAYHPERTPMAKTVSLTLPLTRADLADLEVGDEVLLSGPVYTMRDAGHERALQCLEDTGHLPFDLEGATLFYAGPTPAAAGRPLGSVGPTTGSRMDFATPRLFEAGIVAAIGRASAAPRS